MMFKRMSDIRLWSAATAAIVCMGLHAQALAEEAAPESSDRKGDEEIVVTASKSGATALSRTAVTANVVDAEALAERNITSPGDLQTQVPGLVVDSGSGAPKITIRGVGHDLLSGGAENGVAVYVDGILIGRPVALISPYNDLARVEVLKGPQGTSFGRNATGGAINYITTKPTEGFSGNLNLQYGSFDRRRGGGALNYGSDAVGVRVSGYYQEDEGFTTNRFTGARGEGGHEYAFRVNAYVKPTDNLKLEYLFDYARDLVRGPSEVIVSNPAVSRVAIFPVLFPAAFPNPQPSPLLVTPNKNYDFSYNLPTSTSTRLATHGLTASLDLGAVTLRSITSYQRTKNQLIIDADASALPLISIEFQKYDVKQFTQELVAVADLGSLQLTAGGFYLRENARSNGQVLFFITTPSGVRIDRSAHQITKSYAGFAEARLSLSDTVRVTGGLRYTEDKKSMDQIQFITTGPASASPGIVTRIPFVGSDSWSKMTFNAGVEADLSASTFAFAKVGRGFKAGGFNDSVPGNNYDPETLTSYEAGIKGRAWDRRIQYALSVFYSQYKDIQVSIIPPGASVVYENAAEGTIWGIDFQGSVDVGSGVSVDTALSYIPTAKYDEYLSRDPFGLTCGNATVECNLSGNRLNRVPRFSGTFGLNYRHQLEEERAVTARVELYRASATVYSAFDYPGATEPAYTLLNAYLSADVTPQLTLRLYGKNLTDKLYMSGRVPNSGVNHIFGYYGRPREFGAEAALRF